MNVCETVSEYFGFVDESSNLETRSTISRGEISKKSVYKSSILGNGIFCSIMYITQIRISVSSLISWDISWEVSAFFSMGFALPVSETNPNQKIFLLLILVSKTGKKP